MNLGLCVGKYPMLKRISPAGPRGSAAQVASVRMARLQGANARC
jgi:hypothetical protein